MTPMHPVRRLGLLTLVALPASAAALLAAPAPTGDTRLDDIHAAAVGDELPPGWDVRPVSGHEAPVTEVVVDDERGKVLRFVSDGQAAFYGNELDTHLDPATGRLRWSWRVDRTLESADLREPDADDSLARVMVVFGDRGLFSRPNILFYTWGNDESVGVDFPSRVDDRLHIIVLRNADDPVKTWVEEERDLLADYRRAFGGKPDEPVTAIGFMSDTENLPTAGVSLLGPVTWLPTG